MQPVDILRIPVDCGQFWDNKSVRKLGEVNYEYGPRGEFAGSSSILTQLWEAKDRSLRFKCYYISPSSPFDMEHDALRFDKNCSGTPALWNMDGMRGQFGGKFLKKYQNSWGKPLAVPGGDPLF